MNSVNQRNTTNPQIRLERPWWFYWSRITSKLEPAGTVVRSHGARLLQSQVYGEFASVMRGRAT